MPKKKSEEEELLATTDASHVIGVSVETIRKWAISGKLPSLPVRNGWRMFRNSDCERLAAERRKGPRAVTKPSSPGAA